MSQKILLILKDGEERRVPLDKERLVLGRDKACDVVIEGSSVSRKHAAIVHRFGSVYVENISSTGKILKGEEPVEHAELAEGEEIIVGPFRVLWRLEDMIPRAENGAAAGVSAEAVVADEQAAAPELAPLNDEANDAPAPSEEIQAIEGEVVASSNAPVPAGFDVVSSDDKTKVSPAIVKPILKVIKGEIVGREIYLENGLSWIVGRSAKCHIQVDNQKLSRQHFKIIRIGNSFRIEDMGSANGSRVNGVAVTDAPLQPFDTIQAGPVEIQFLMANASAQPSSPLPHGLPSPEPKRELELDLDGSHQAAQSGEPGAQEKTVFAPPALYSGAPSDSTQIRSAPASAEAPSGQASGSSQKTMPTSPLKAKLDQAIVWFKAQPKQKKILYGSASALILLALLVGLLPEKGKVDVAVTPPIESESPLSKANAASGGDISPEFTMLPNGKQREMQELYAKAERAQIAKEWKTAFESSRTILSVVKKYKRAAEILDEAQIYLNEEAIGNVSRSLSSVKDAERENEERLGLFVASGEKALKEGRWEDAAESFSKALNLDPSNAKAIKGFAAANARDRTAYVDAPKFIPPPPKDPDAEKKQIERDEVDGLKREFQEARSKMLEKQYHEGLGRLKKLDQKLYDRIGEYRSGRRAPASIRDELSTEVGSLQGKVKEALEVIRTELKAEYQTQLSDAEQFETNRQLIQAREIYDRIIKAEPNFEEALDLRTKLYSKILTEARSVYQEALIYESVGDLENARDGFTKSRDLLTNVRDASALEYYRRSATKLKRLQR